MNDGLNNEYQIIKAYNNKRIKELTSKQKSVINSFDSFDSDDYFIKAKKVKGNYKPDIDFIIKKKDYLVSVKKGSGNSVHQEKIETFVTFCKEYLDMSNDVEEALLYYLYGDGTLDGSGNISNRLGNDDVKKKYSKEIEVIDNFFDEHAMDLIERFLVTGRFGRDSGIIAKYLYHGTYEKGVICKLNNLSIEYIANQKKNKGNGLHIGPLTVQTWNRNLNNNPKNEYRRDSIQVKCGISFHDLILEINSYLRSVEQVKIRQDKNIRGDNSHGFRNQLVIIEVLNGTQFKKLNNNLRKFIREIYPNIKNTDVIYAKKIKNAKLKPKMQVTVNGLNKYCSIKTGSGNSIHQEKLNTFIIYLKSIDISDDLIEILLKFIYGDGTIDGTGPKNARLDEKKIIENLGEDFEKLNKFFFEHRIELAKRFLIYGAYDGTPSDMIYYGTEFMGISLAYDKIINYISSLPYKKGKLYVGPLVVQTWNRNLNGDISKDFKRNSIQVKWPNLDFDLKEIKTKHQNNTSINGVQAEYDLVFSLNTIKSTKHSIWKIISSNLKLSNLDNI